MKLNYKELAFILDIKPIEALEKILYVHCKVTGKAVPAACDTVKEYLFEKSKNKSFRNNLPESLDVGLLALHLNIPSLQNAVEDIQKNYLNRPATKKYILCDYPEKQIKKCTDADKPIRIPFPSALESLMTIEIVEMIKEEWRKRFPKARIA